MNNIGTTPTQNLPNLVTPFTSPSKVAVGLETAEMKDVAVTPVEQSSESSRLLNRRQLGDKSIASDEPRVDALADDDAGNQQQDAEEQEKQAVISQLAARDREVRQHEAAHAAVGGALAGAPQFNYVRGPDGVLYAQSGEVAISIPPVAGEPEEIIKNAEQVQRAALAPAEPSPQDRSVAAQAVQIAQQARADLAAETMNTARGDNDPTEETESEERVAATGDISTEEKLREQEAQKALRQEALDEQRREQEARREEMRRAANAERFIEIQNTPIVPVNDLTQRILGLSKVEQDLKVGSVLNQRI